MMYFPLRQRKHRLRRVFGESKDRWSRRIEGIVFKDAGVGRRLIPSIDIRKRKSLAK